MRDNRLSRKPRSNWHCSLRMLSIERNKPPASFTSTTPVKDYVKDTVDGYERCINLLKSSWHPSSCDLLIPIIPPGLMALYLMTKRNFKPYTLKHKGKWSENFNNILREALQKDPLKRPLATKLLKHKFGHCEFLINNLAMSLIKELKAVVKNNKKKVETHLHLNYNFNLKPVKYSLLRTLHV